MFTRRIQNDEELPDEFERLRTFLGGFVEDEDFNVKVFTDRIADNFVRTSNKETVDEVLSDLDRILIKEPLLWREVRVSSNVGFKREEHVRDWLQRLKASLAAARERARDQ